MFQVSRRQRSFVACFVLLIFGPCFEAFGTDSDQRRPSLLSLEEVAETPIFGLRPSEREWIQKAVVHLPESGGTAVTVSNGGLLATAAHAVDWAAVRAGSQRAQRLLRDGFLAGELSEEIPLPMSVWFLESQVDFSNEVSQAIERAEAELGAFYLEAVLARLEAENESPGRVARIRRLDYSDRFVLEIFRVFEDVRLVFLPEQSLVRFGGDEQNFSAPGLAFDFALLRVYDENGQPLKTENYIVMESSWDLSPEAEHLVVGYPAPVDQRQTIPELEFEREVILPFDIRFMESRLEFLSNAIESFGEEALEELLVERSSLKNSLGLAKMMSEQLKESGPWMRARKQEEEEFIRQLSPENRRAYRNALSVIGNLLNPEVSDDLLELTKLYRIFEAPSFYLSPLFAQALAIAELAEAANSGDHDTSGIAEIQEMSPVQFDFEFEVKRLAQSLYWIWKEFGLGTDERAKPVLELLYGEELTGGRHAELGVDHAEAEAYFQRRARFLLEGSLVSDPSALRNFLEQAKAGALPLGFDPDAEPLLALAYELVGELLTFLRAYHQTEMAQETDARERIHEIQSELGLVGDSSPDRDIRFSLGGLSVRSLDADPESQRGPEITTLGDLFRAAEAARSGPGELSSHPDWSLPEPLLQAQRDQPWVERIPVTFSTTAPILGGHSGGPVLQRDIRSGVIKLIGIVFDHNPPSTSLMLEPGAGEGARTAAVSCGGAMGILGKVFRAPVPLRTEMQSGRIASKY